MDGLASMMAEEGAGTLGQPFEPLRRAHTDIVDMAGISATEHREYSHMSDRITASEHVSHRIEEGEHGKIPPSRFAGFPASRVTHRSAKLISKSPGAIKGG
jgi:hypothetical protein